MSLSELMAQPAVFTRLFASLSSFAANGDTVRGGRPVPPQAAALEVSSVPAASIEGGADLLSDPPLPPASNCTPPPVRQVSEIGPLGHEGVGVARQMGVGGVASC